MALIDGRRVAVELKYLLRGLATTVEEELFELPFQSAQDVRRYDFVKDIAQLETCSPTAPRTTASRLH